MVVKTLKIPAGLSARIQRKARATKSTASAVMREAIERGLGAEAGLDMAVELKDIIGSASGPGDLSTNKAYLHDYGRSRSR
jgi:hypothetical protein